MSRLGIMHNFFMCAYDEVTTRATGKVTSGCKKNLAKLCVTKLIIRIIMIIRDEKNIFP